MEKILGASTEKSYHEIIAVTLFPYNKALYKMMTSKLFLDHVKGLKCPS